MWRVDLYTGVAAAIESKDTDSALKALVRSFSFLRARLTNVSQLIDGFAVDFIPFDHAFLFKTRILPVLQALATETVLEVLFHPRLGSVLLLRFGLLGEGRCSA